MQTQTKADLRDATGNFLFPGMYGYEEALAKQPNTTQGQAAPESGTHAGWHGKRKYRIESDYCSNLRVSDDIRGAIETDEHNPRTIVIGSAELAHEIAHRYNTQPALLAACKLWERAERNSGVSMADFRTIASNAIRAAIAQSEGRAQ